MYGIYGTGGSYGGEGGSEDESHDPPLPAGQFNRPNNFGSNGAQGSYNGNTFAGKKKFINSKKKYLNLIIEVI